MPSKPENSTTDFALWEKYGRSLLDNESEASWKIAEWVHAGTHSHNKTVYWISQRFGLTESICHRYRRVVSMFPKGNRHHDLSFSHHLAVVGLDADVADGLLRTAVQNRQTCEQLRKIAKNHSDQAQIEALRKENESLKKRLKNANERLAAETVERITGSVTESLKATNRGYRQTASAIEDLGKSGLLDYVHGNARRGAIRNLERLVNSTGRKNEAALQRISAAIASLSGGGDE